MADHHAIDVGGVRLVYQVSGPPGAQPLVILHALGEDATDWDIVAAVFARSWGVYALDLRGHGQGDWPGEYSLQLMRDDVLGFLDALALDRVDLLGHSMGGIVAYLLAEDYPQRVDRLVLEDVPIPHPREQTTPTRPDGKLTFDWEMVLAVRRQVDTPDAGWLQRLSRITAKTLVVAGGPRSHVPGHLIHKSEPMEFTKAVLEFL
ncbi:alpha/beta fold hydrolase [Streptomyces diastatochromogenes]|uniref:alpha/beta fold hydrolase n=1 Tax=Streptomyces diastatochromogenes TaxID=42236 RepID=UPI00364BEFEE